MPRRFFVVALAPWLLSCNPEQGPLLPAENRPPPAEAPPAGGARTLRLMEHAEGVAAADLDGDGSDELIYVRDGRIFLGTEEVAAPAAALQVVARGDIDGDGDEEAILAFGVGRSHRGAQAQVWAVHSAERAELLWAGGGERAQVADLRVIDGQIFLARFVDERTVEGGWLIGGAVQRVGATALGTAQIPLPDGDLLVGRLYGDEPRSDGDLRRMRGDDAVATLPSLRGVRALAAADLDGDDALEVVVADGWHYQYGHRADGHVRLLDGPDLDQSRTIARLEKSYTVNRIEVVPHTDPLKRALLLTGASAVHLLRRDALGWGDVRLESISETGNAVVVQMADGPWALISGTPATLFPLDLE